MDMTTKGKTAMGDALLALHDEYYRLANVYGLIHGTNKGFDDWFKGELARKVCVISNN